MGETAEARRSRRASDGGAARGGKHTGGRAFRAAKGAAIATRSSLHEQRCGSNQQGIYVVKCIFFPMDLLNNVFTLIKMRCNPHYPLRGQVNDEWQTSKAAWAEVAPLFLTNYKDKRVWQASEALRHTRS